MLDTASDGSKEKHNAAYLKRREQVRRAQRTHRERKEAYIKSLETQVIQHRTHEARLRQEKRQLQTELGRLKSIVEHSGYARTHSDPSPFWQLQNTSTCMGNPSFCNQLDVRHHQTSVFSRYQLPPTNEFSLCEGDGSLSFANAACRFRNAQSHNASDVESPGPHSLSGLDSASTDIPEFPTCTSELYLNDFDVMNLGPHSALRSGSPNSERLESTFDHSQSWHAPAANAFPTSMSSRIGSFPQSGTRVSQECHSDWSIRKIGREGLLTQSNTPF